MAEITELKAALAIRNGESSLNEDELQIKTKAGSEVDVNITTDTIGLAKESGGNLDTIAGDTTSLDGKITACDTGNIAGTVTANAGTNLNTSALALESGGNLDTIAGDTTSIDGKTPSLGQAVKANSVPVTLASDQGSIDVNIVSEISGNNIQNRSLASGILSGASSNHVYQNTTGNTLYVKEIMFTGSDIGRMQVFIGVTGDQTDTLVDAGYITSGSPDVDRKYEVELEVPNNEYITIRRTNSSNKTADYFSRVSGTY